MKIRVDVHQFIDKNGSIISNNDAENLIKHLINLKYSKKMIAKYLDIEANKLKSWLARMPGTTVYEKQILKRLEIISRIEGHPRF